MAAPMSEARVRQYKKYVSKGMSLGEIARHDGVHFTTACQHIDRMGMRREWRKNRKLAKMGEMEVESETKGWQKGEKKRGRQMNEKTIKMILNLPKYVHEGMPAVHIAGECKVSVVTVAKYIAKMQLRELYGPNRKTHYWKAYTTRYDELKRKGVEVEPENALRIVVRD